MLDTPSKLRILSEQRESADDETLPLVAALAFVRGHKTVILTCLLVACELTQLRREHTVHVISKASLTRR